MTQRVSGTLTYHLPVAPTFNTDDPAEAERLFLAWAQAQTMTSPDGERFAPGVSQDESRPAEMVASPFDGVTIDYVEFVEEPCGTHGCCR